MKLFKDAIYAVERVLFNDHGWHELCEAMADMKVSYIPIGAFFGDEGDKPPKRAEGDMVKLASMIRDGLDGVCEIDDLLSEIERLRESLVSRIFEMRHAYVPPESEAIEKLCKMGDERTGKVVSGGRDFLAEFLCIENRDMIVNPRIFPNKSKLYVLFDVANTPTSIEISIPREVDWRFNGGPRLFRDFRDSEAGCPTPDLRDVTNVDIGLRVKLGAVADAGEYEVNIRDSVVSECHSLEELRDRIGKAINMDVRTHINGVEDIRDVKTLDDFVRWRGMRAANASAKRHGVV